MVKNDFEMLVTAVLVTVLVALTNIESISKSVNSLNLEIESFKQSTTYQSFLGFKNSESNFWSDLKGTKPNSGQVADIFQNPTVEVESKNVQQIGKIQPPVKFLLLGDSMMLVGFGPALENSLLKFNGVSVVREGVYSTGLNRIDYYDWFTKTDELISKNNPDVLIVMFGGNDGQGIVDKEKKAYEFGSESWKEVYRQRVNIYLSRVSPKVKKVYWVGHPITGNQSFLDKFQTMNPIYQTECAKFPNAVFVDTWERFAVNGQFRQSIPDDNGLWQIAKASDGVHVTDFGGKILTDLLIKKMSKDVELK